MDKLFEKYTVDDCIVVDLPLVHQDKGDLTALENSSSIPFDVKRVYYLYDVPYGADRGGHAHYELQQYVMAASGSFVFVLDDGTNTKEVFLNSPRKALHIKPGIWREMKDFSSGSICLVLASNTYHEGDYMRDYHKFEAYRNVSINDYDEEFLDLSWKWLNDPEIKYLTNSSEFTKKSQRTWFNTLPDKVDYFIKGVSFDREKIGVVGLKRINAQDKSAEYFGYIGEKKHWSKGFGSLMLYFAEHTAKNKYGLSRIHLEVIADNLRAIKAYEKFGFLKTKVSDNIIYMEKNI